jgi:hypothetical protein
MSPSGRTRFSGLQVTITVIPWAGPSLNPDITGAHLHAYKAIVSAASVNLLVIFVCCLSSPKNHDLQLITMKAALLLPLLVLACVVIAEG